MARWRADRVWLVYRGAESFAMVTGWTLAPVYFVQEVGMDPLQLVLTGTFMEIAYFLAHSTCFTGPKPDLRAC
jgi:MFS transporter, DHA3 family, tetracycline resistance protein